MVFHFSKHVLTEILKFLCELYFIIVELAAKLEACHKLMPDHYRWWRRKEWPWWVERNIYLYLHDRPISLRENTNMRLIISLVITIFHLLIIRHSCVGALVLVFKLLFAILFMIQKKRCRQIIGYLDSTIYIVNVQDISKVFYFQNYSWQKSIKTVA